MTRIILRGCNGRMGRMITELAAGREDLAIVAGVDVFDQGQNKYPVFPELAVCNVEADALIDFSNPKGLKELLSACAEKKLPAVLCSTGYSAEELDLIREAAKTQPVFRSANMSLGINTLTMLLKEATKVLAPAGFDIEIVEKHHNQKLDAPSGTAIMLADAINSELNCEYAYKYDRSTVREKRPVKEIGISAVRGGTIVGEHEVIFAGTDEVIEIKHTAYSRAVFAKGALEAAAFMAGKGAGMYSMEDVIASK